MTAELQQSHFTAERIAARLTLANARAAVRRAANAATSAWIRGKPEPTPGTLAAAQAAETLAEDALRAANRSLYKRVPMAPQVIA